MSAPADPAALTALARAYNFAARRHQSQKRKGDAAEPYVIHLTEVAELVAQATGGADPEAVMAAVLHDCIEDQDVRREELAELFGERVASIVVEVTDDKTSNLRSLLTSPPTGWSIRRIADYLAWSRAVVAGCRGVSSWLEARFDEAAAALAESLPVEA